MYIASEGMCHVCLVTNSPCGSQHSVIDPANSCLDYRVFPHISPMCVCTLHAHTVHPHVHTHERMPLCACTH